MNKMYVGLAVVFGLPIVYALSAIIIAVICIQVFHMASAPPWFDYIYSPLRWAVDHSTVFGDIFKKVANSVGAK